MSAEKLQFFAESLAEICAHSLIARDRPLRWLVIANPTAGGFVMRSRWKKCCQVLQACRAAARANPPHKNCAPAMTAMYAGCIPTERPGSAADIAKALVDMADFTKIASNAMEATAKAAASAIASKMPILIAKTAAPPFYLIITAGGDGTSLEVLSVLYDAPAAVRARIAVLRLPMGTGNDGADSPDLACALNLLIQPSRIEYTPALRLIPAPDGPAAAKSPYLAFNILSVGLDAFVTHMTNKMKGKLPGDFYKLWVDIASLLYDSLYTVDFLDVRAVDEKGKEISSFREKLLLLAVGASGQRTYGSQKKILPDDRNVCALRQMPLSRKLALKGLFATGTHIDKPEAILFNAHRIEFSGRHPMLAQMDGETILLQRQDFPAAIELTEPVIPVLKLAH